MARSTGTKHHLAYALTGLANSICDETADYDHAFGLYQESLEIYEELGNAHGIAKNLINQGAILDEQGNYLQAEQLYQQSLKIYREVDYSYGISAALNYLAGVNRKLANFENAKKLTVEGLALNHETGNRHSILESLLEIGMLSIEMGEYMGAYSYFCEALQLTLDMEAPTLSLKVILGFARLFEKTGKIKSAADLAALVLSHEEVGQEVREQAERLCAELEKKLAPTVMEQCRSDALKIDIEKTFIELLCNN